MLVFAATIFLSAFLLFQIQPLIAKVILPWFGGAPNVWTTCMLFFQVVLLGGYLYAHALNRLVHARWQWLVHGILLICSLVTLNIIPSGDWKPTPENSNVIRILVILAVTIGLPYFVLSTTGPLIQAAFARRFVGRSPYRLFALSNLGSLLALVTFPFLFEPFFPTGQHAWGWTTFYIVFAGLCFWALVMSRQPVGSTTPSRTVGAEDPKVEPADSVPRSVDASRSTIWEFGAWVVLSLVPSVLLLATTNHLSHSVAVLPFLWIAPLALYLVSFIICFEKPAWYRRDVWGVALVIGMTLTILGPHIDRAAMALRVMCYLFALFAAAMVCHGELAALRPESRRLTLYYLMISVGGALGGMFVVLVAPQVFVKFHELQLGFIATSGLFAWRLLANRDYLAAFRVALIGSWILLFVSLLVAQLAPEFMKRAPLERGTLVFAMWFATFTSLMHRRAEFAIGRGRDTVFGSMALNSTMGVLIFGLLVVLTSGLMWWPELAIDFGLIGVLLWVALLAVAALVCNGQFPPLAKYTSVIASSFVIVAATIGTNFWGYQMVHRDPKVIYQSRDFFGLLSINEEKSDFEGDLRSMYNGQVLHGFQYIKIPENRMRRTTYFGSLSGVGIALDHHPRRETDAFKIGVIGLGTGSVAVYARPGDSLVFYEIKPDCILAAKKYFYYLSDNPAGEEHTRVQPPEDARIVLERELQSGRSEQFDILIVDAFSGDSPPRHLLTRESFEVYQRHTKADGIIAFNITNGHFAFNRVILDLAQHAGWKAEWFIYQPTQSGSDRFLYTSIWALVTQNEEFLNLPVVRERKQSWQGVTPVKWTDDFGGLWQILIFQRPAWLPEAWFGKKS